MIQRHLTWNTIVLGSTDATMQQDNSHPVHEDEEEDVFLGEDSEGEVLEGEGKPLHTGCAVLACTTWYTGGCAPHSDVSGSSIYGMPWCSRRHVWCEQQ